jgi:biopolymer transport protein ExbB/TolQ
METMYFSPLLANAFKFAMDKATLEGKITIGLLIIVSLFSWTVIINKALQLYKASKMSKKFYAAYRSTRDPLDIFNKSQEFPGAPAYEIYFTGTEELAYHLKNNPVEVRKGTLTSITGNKVTGAETDHLARATTIKISNASFESVKVALERSVSAQAISLEKGMIILTTAVAGG